MNILDTIKNKHNLITASSISSNEIKVAEELLDTIFSDEYKLYLSEFGFAIFENHELTGICHGKRLDVIKNTLYERKYNPFVPKELYVIETLDIDGIVIWQNKKGEIFRTFPNGNIEKIFSSLCEYIAD